MQYAASSFKDLGILVPRVNGQRELIKKKFIVFFDCIKEAEDACKYLRSLLLPSEAKKLIRFRSIMSSEFRDDETRKIAEGKRVGVFGTDSIGMVSVTGRLLVFRV